MTEQANNLRPIAVPLQLRFGAVPAQRSPAAWYIAGSGSDWLDEIGRWGVPLAAVRLLAMPVGVLAIVDGDAKVKVSSRAQPYTCQAGRLFLPAEARLHPPVSDSEITRQLGDDIAALHPTLGLVRSPRLSVPTALALCRIAPPETADWSLAVPGVYVEPRIRSIEPLEPPGMEMVLRSLKDDISTDSPDELPPLPDEKTPRRLINQAKAGMLNMLAKGLRGGGLASSAGSPLARLGAWAANKAAGLSQDLSAARHRELARLMKLLERNPDAGLRFALPLTAENTGRGVAPPGHRLTRRDTNFSLGSLFGSGPADTWDTSDDMRAQLTAKYRELANRELSLGRHRRAAYIYAELLGDFSSAANVLMQGRFWREAAALYREKLKQIRTAAECLEKGGLLSEAITIYDELKDYEKVGDLFAVMQRPDDAEAAYRLAIDAAFRVPNHLDAARVLEQKLKDPNGALQALDGGWPQSDQASGCLHAAFALIGRHNWHDRAQQRLRDLHKLRHDEHAAGMVAEVLAAISRDYPTRDVRTQAADLTRVIAGSRLAAGAKLAETRRLLEAVQKSTIEDRLLVRDIGRFQAQRPPDRPAVPPPLPVARRAAASVKAPEVVNQFRLPKGVRWLKAEALPQSLVAVGIDDQAVVVARVTYDGRIQRALFEGSNADEHWFTLAANRDDILVAPLAEEKFVRMRAKTLPAGHGLLPATVGWPDYLPIEPLAGFAQTDGTIWVATYLRADALLLRTYYRGGRLLATREVPIAPAPIVSFLTASERYAWLCMGDRVHAVHHGSESLEPIQLRAPVVAVTTSPPNTLFRIVARHAEGVSIIWPLHQQALSFATDLVDAAACLGRDGLLVAIGSNGGRVTRLEGHDITTPMFFQTSGPAPCEIITTPFPDTLAAIHADGRVDYLRFH